MTWEKSDRITIWDLLIESESNVSRGGAAFWATANRAAEQRATILDTLKDCWPDRPVLSADYFVVFTLTRIAPRTLDSGDNISTAFKHVKDAIAEWLGVNDRDPRIKWLFEQRKLPKRYGLIIEIQPRVQICTACGGRGVKCI